MLCGISDRFQSLSPSERQVAHALLTRPPLSLPRLPPKIPSQSFVRLACVRHAASVHPEPGSNSLKNSIISMFPSLRSSLEYWFTLTTSLTSFFAYRELLFEKYSSQKNSIGFLFIVVQFSMFCTAVSQDSSLSILLRLLFVKRFFIYFLKFFRFCIRVRAFLCFQSLLPPYIVLHWLLTARRPIFSHRVFPPFRGKNRPFHALIQILIFIGVCAIIL